MEKIRYSTDPHNRLVTTSGGRGIPRQRKALDGVFKVVSGNSLEYHVRAAAGAAEAQPQCVRLKGSWRLSDDHDLAFCVEGSKAAGAEEFAIRGEIIDVKAGAILYSVTTKHFDGTQATYVIELAGRWQADADNRLMFAVTKAVGAPDALVFRAAWEVDGNNEIVYRYERSGKGAPVHELIFKGSWLITERGRMTYALDLRSNSAFEFTLSRITCASDHILGEVGIRLKNRLRPAIRTITLLGSWRIDNGTGLSFEIETTDGTLYRMELGAEIRLTKNDAIRIALKDPVRGRALGAELEFSHRILCGDGESFIRFLKSREEASIVIGAGFRW